MKKVNIIKSYNALTPISSSICLRDTFPSFARNKTSLNTVTKDSIVKASCQLNGTGTAALQDSYNVDSITDNGTGYYTITWKTAFSNDDYSVAVGLGDDDYLCYRFVTASYATDSIVIRVVKVSDRAANDPTMLNIIAIGDQT